MSIVNELHVIGLSLGAKGSLNADNRVVLELIRRWSEMGVPVTLYTDHAGYLLAQETDLRLITYTIWGSQNWRRLGPLQGLIRGIDGFFRVRKLSTNGLIYSISNSWSDVLPAQRLRRRNRKAKWVGNVKSVSPKHFVRFAATFASNTQILRNADLFLTLNESDNNGLPRRLEHRSYTLRSGLDKPESTPKRVRKKQYDACFVATAETMAGWKTLAETWRHVQLYRPDSTIAVMVGNTGPLLPIIKHLFNKEGSADTVTWLIDPNRKTKQRTLLAGRVFMAPITDANMGIVGQAMAVGLPVIGFDSPAFKLDYKAGRLTVPAGDWASLGHLLIYVLTHRNVYLRLKKEARETAAVYSRQECAGRALKFLRTA